MPKLLYICAGSYLILCSLLYTAHTMVKRLFGPGFPQTSRPIMKELCKVCAKSCAGMADRSQLCTVIAEVCGVHREKHAASFSNPSVCTHVTVVTCVKQNT